MTRTADEILIASPQSSTAGTLRLAVMWCAWFTADEEFGQNPGLRDYLEGSRIPYVMAVPKNTRFTDTAGQVTLWGSRSRPVPLTWVVGVLGRQGMIVRRVVAPALLDLPSAAELAVVARPLVDV
ncbi:MAG: hypothetical protein ACRDTH_04910 [Pseudonocardiaceae bacterium]